MITIGEVSPEVKSRVVALFDRLASNEIVRLMPFTISTDTEATLPSSSVKNDKLLNERDLLSRRRVSSATAASCFRFSS